MQICLAIYHAAIYLFHKEHYRHVTAMGYSAVIFGWMAMLSARKMLLSLTTCFPLHQHHCIARTLPTPSFACNCTNQAVSEYKAASVQCSMVSSPVVSHPCRPVLTAAPLHCNSVVSIIYHNVSAGGISNFSIFGMVQLPMSLAPFGALVITSVIIPQASFIGHLSGILMGYLMAYVLYGLTVNLWCSLALLALLTAGKHERRNMSYCIS